MGVKTKRGGDNKLRKTGDVGSHSTLVTEAKTPTTNINSVNIDKVKKPVQKIDNPELIKVLNEEKAAKAELARITNIWIDTAASDPTINEIERNFRKAKTTFYELSKKREKIEIDTDLKIAKSELARITKSWNKKDLDAAKLAVSKLELIADLHIARDTYDEAFNAAMKLESQIPELMGARAAWEALGAIVSETGDSYDLNAYNDAFSDYYSIQEQYYGITDAWRKVSDSAYKVTQLAAELKEITKP